jgi:ribonuclease HI
VDFTFMRDELDDDEGSMYDDAYDDDSEGQYSPFDPLGRDGFEQLLDDMEFEKRRGTGSVFPSEFRPPSPTSTPATLFRESADPIRTRFVRKSDPSTCLFYTDGACINNGKPNSQAGWAFVFGPEPDARTSTGRLELNGPFGDPCEQTSNRAELRAVIEALRAWDWAAEGFRTIVIATDSEYAVKGATEWTRNWVRNGWKTSSRKPVQNRDLWEMLLGEAERYDENGMKIELWWIPRAANTIADRAAKKAAQESDVTEFTNKLILGV